MNVEEFLSNPGLRHPRFVIIDNRTGCFIDTANSIKERNEKIRRLVRQWRFDVRWDYYASVIRKANPTGILFINRLYYTMELNIAREAYPEYFNRAGGQA